VTQLWNTVLFEPMLNSLLFLYSLLGRNFGLSIIVFTLLVRLLTLPVTMKQMRSARASQELQPKLQELQKKYKNDRQKLAEEQMKLYKEAGVNPLGCLLPTLIQMPIWIGLYQSIINVLPDNPMRFLSLAQHVYQQFPILSSLLPLNSSFLGLDLGRPNPILAVLVAATMWMQQKMMAAPSTDPQQQAMSQSMELMMPLMFGAIVLQTASGLGLYFVVSNIAGIVQQYFVSGWGSLATVFSGRGSTKTAHPKGKDNGRTK